MLESVTSLDSRMSKSKKRNVHCPVPGCRTQQPHLLSSTTASLHQIFSNPERLAEWVKCCIAELINSVIGDINSGRFFAYLTRWRQPQELYCRALYILFVAEEAAVPHIVSGELPNSFSRMWESVNETVFDGKAALDAPLTGLRGEQFTAMNTLNESAHASLATIVMCVEFARKPDFRAPIIDKHLAYWKTLCNHLDQIEKAFKTGRNKQEVLAEFKLSQGRPTQVPNGPPQ